LNLSRLAVLARRYGLRDRGTRRRVAPGEGPPHKVEESLPGYLRVKSPLSRGESTQMTIGIMIEVETSDGEATTVRLSINGAVVAKDLGLAEAQAIIAKLFERLAPPVISRRRPRAFGGRIAPA
jgi:hypothetical protein